MFIITASDNNYKDILESSVNQTKKAGYFTQIYDINESLGYGEYFSPMEFMRDLGASKNREFIKCGIIPYKPYIIRKALFDYKQFTTWLDADAFIIKNIDELEKNDDFDIAVTMRSQEEVLQYPKETFPWLGLLNAGVIFLRHNEQSLKFVDLWIKELFETKFMSDQEALNKVVLKACNLDKDCYNQIYNLGDIRIKILKTEEYNYYYYPKEPEKETKIIHLKRNKGRDATEWFNRDWQKI